MKQAAKEKLGKSPKRKPSIEAGTNSRALRDQEAVLIEAWGLQACFAGVQFAYEKKSFPRIATNGLLDLTANGVSVQLAFGVSPDEDNENGAGDENGTAEAQAADPAVDD